MVTLQILVLSFLVRIQVAQLNGSLSRVVFLLYAFVLWLHEGGYATYVMRRLWHRCKHRTTNFSCQSKLYSCNTPNAMPQKNKSCST